MMLRATQLSEHDDKTRAEVLCGIFYAAELVRVDNIARDPYNEKIAYACREYQLRHHPRIRAGMMIAYGC